VGECSPRMREQTCLDIRNFGAKSIEEVKQSVDMGLSLKDSRPGSTEQVPWTRSRR